MFGYHRSCLALAAAMCLVLSCLSGVFSDSRAAEPADTEKLFDLPLDQLLDMEITTAGKKAEKIGDIPASVVVVTREDIETYGYATLSEILEHVPGMYKINDYSWDGYDKFGVRGFWNVIANDDIMIQVNGIDQVDNVHTNYPLNKIAVPVEAIERIEVVRGPMSVIYGSGAFFGVINIITDEAGEESGGIVSASVGTQDTRKVMLKASGSQGRMRYSLTGSFASTGGIDRAYGEMTDDPSLRSGGTRGLLEGEEKYFGFSGAFDKFYVDFAYSETEEECYLLFPSIGEGSPSSVVTANSVIGYRNRISDLVSVDAGLGYFRSRHKVDYQWSFEDFYGYQEIPSAAYDIHANAFFTPSDDLDITVGLSHRAVSDVQNRLHLPSAGWEIFYNTTHGLAHDEEIVTRALFAQVAYRPLDRLELVGGLRLERMEDYRIELRDADHSQGKPAVVRETICPGSGTETIPRFAAIYRVDDSNVLKFLYGQATNPPSSWQMIDEFAAGREPALEAEDIRTFEINYVSLPFPNLMLDLSLFWNQLGNLIVRRHGMDENGEYYSGSANAGEMETLGAEVTLRATPTENSEIEVSAAYQSTEDKSYPDIDPAYSPNFLGYAKASYRFGKGISLGLVGNYVGPMKAEWMSDPDGTGRRIGEDVDGHFSLDANLRFRDLFDKGWYLNVRGANLLDEDVRYPATTNNDTLFPKGTLGMGRRFLVSVGWKF